MVSLRTLIGFAYDAGYAKAVEKYRALLEGTSYENCPCTLTRYDPGQEMSNVPKELSKQDLTLAFIGHPGATGYKEQLYGFMNMYAASKRPPVMGLVSHDEAHTRYVLGQWLRDIGAGKMIPELPEGLINIVDARGPLRSEVLQVALNALDEKRQVLLGMYAPPLSGSPKRGIPSPVVAVNSLEFHHVLPGKE